ncbi:MAG: hypothetical protein QG635_173 [Bacteroidota bacterium]|nr:hypothetical protein [Bacteroidota bacterium]
MTENNELNKLVLEDAVYTTNFTKKHNNRKAYTIPDKKLITAFIPGTIRDVFAKEGTSIRRGDKLLVLEAMKMLNDIRSPLDGIIKQVHVKQGDKVVKNQVLAELI